MHLDNPDPLSQLLVNLKLHAEVYVNHQFCGNWAIDTSGSRRVPFHLVGDGDAWLHIKENDPINLKVGDLIMFPKDHEHILSNNQTSPSVNLINHPSQMEINEAPIEDSTQMICGVFEFKNPYFWPLLDSLPDCLILSECETDTNPVIKQLIGLMLHELENASPGHYAAVNQIAYLMFVQVLREQITSGNIENGLLPALFDPKIGKSLQAIHQTPEVAWTLSSLAQEAGMGRSAFSSKFHSLVGMTATQYLSQWRMKEASTLLKYSDFSVQKVSELSGYESEPAFRRAFKSYTGKTPGAVRREGQQKNSSN